MDPLSQGALGAVAAMVVAKPDHARAAGLAGALAGMAPDLDVVIRSSHDPLLFLEYHRQFTHALVFIPIGALICSLVFLPFARGRLPNAVLYRSCLFGYASHGLLDACTSYGTQLFWPVSDLRVAWNNVSVVDPLMTIVLLLLVGRSVARRSPRLARVALAWVVAYLLLGVVQRERAEDVGRALADARGHAPAIVTAKPAFGSLLLWKTVYRESDRYYVDAARLGFGARAYTGQSAAALDLARDFPWLSPNSQQARDVERFRWFSRGQIALDPKRSDRIIDVRYSMLPNRIAALWGIELRPGVANDDHVVFFNDREVTPEDRSDLLKMWRGDAGRPI